ncbi:BAR domain-containing family protein [Pyronema domesticum]|uniref:Similar to Protein GVP36 acc. no. P40531 n=1 Tax=Pyronema omphalodes (strain CBS 100304) TaxID=1076935 RepID=U4KUD1_PYROM|nr:BAR domain-containing family protein [Pyronema domesticum]CCX04316.1 Similar to Protein GVP36; acc. no. P40531 [Pyronema omphalodes CBS 100304]
MDMSKFQNFGKSISSSFSPFAARTGQFMREQLGQAEDKTQLSPEYLELEKRVDALRQVHQQLLAVTAQYANQSYDYPPNYRESIVVLSSTISERVQLLASANSAAEAQQALTKPGTKPASKTFPHAIGRAAWSSARILQQNDPLAIALDKYALACEHVGDARIQQDNQIVSRFNDPFNDTLKKINSARNARRDVENARLTLDAAKSKAKNGGLGFPPIPMAGRKDNLGEEHLTEQQQLEIETAEDTFFGHTQEAIRVMEKVLDTPEPLRNLAELIQAQLEFHKQAFDIYSKLAGEINSLQDAQESGYRQSREEGA